MVCLNIKDIKTGTEGIGGGEVWTFKKMHEVAVCDSDV